MALLLTHHKQQMFYAKLLRTAGWKFTIIAHKQKSFRGALIDINDFWPTTIGYHPIMETLVGTIHRKYTMAPPDLSRLTETEILTNGTAYRYCIMNDDTYCPILLAKLLVMKNVVVLMVSSQDIMRYYSSCTVCNEDQVKDLNAVQLRSLGEQLYESYTKIPCVLPEQPVMDADEVAEAEDEEPEDQYSQPQHARITKDKNGAQHLELTPTHGPDSLPNIIIMTQLPEKVEKWQQMLLQRCWLDNRYPINRISWWVQTVDGCKPEWWVWGGDCVQFYSTYPPSSESEFIVHWALGYYYFPHSTYAKIKLMLDNGPSVDCVGSSVLGTHCLQSNQGYELHSATGELSNTAVVGYRSHRRPACESGSMDWEGWISTYMDIPFNFNAVQITDTDHERQNAIPVIKLLSPEMRSFINKLYRTLRI